MYTIKIVVNDLVGPSQIFRLSPNCQVIEKNKLDLIVIIHVDCQ